MPRYQSVPNAEEPPDFPPGYNDIESRLSDETPIASPVRSNTSIDSLTRELQEFEIEEPTPSYQHTSLITRAGFATKRFATNINVRIIHPVTRMLDPVYESIKNLNLQWDSYMSKIGNPLIIKRLLYVFFVTIIIFFITKTSISQGNNNVDDFFDNSILNDYVPQILDLKGMKENLEYLSSMPHISGTRGDLTLARYVESYFKNNGISSIEFYEVESFLNYGNDSTSYLKSGDDSFQAKLYEMDQHHLEYLAFNPDSLETENEVKGHVIYANYGTKDDFEKLTSSNVILRNSIVLMKYGKIPPSIKVNIAQDHGCSAVIFVANNDDAYPHDSIPREHVGVTRYAPGDILTPGWASINDYTQRLTWDQTKSTVKLPSVPISWNDASVILSKLSNSGIEYDEHDLRFDELKSFWSGNITSDEANFLALKNSPNTRSKHSIWNVIGRIDGKEQFEKGIFIGAARDSACFGSINPNTGTAILLELAKIFSLLQRKFNWQPLRTIYFLSFDGTDYNLAGSTEWVETRIQQLKKQGYAYIDLSDAVGGTELSVRSHPVLTDVIKQVLQESGDPKDGKAFASKIGKIKNLNDLKNYIPFVSMIGIPSVEIKYTGIKYAKNTCYDNFDNFEKNGDESMVYHKSLVEILARLIIRLVEDPLIPYNMLDMASALQHYTEDIKSYSRYIAPEMTDQVLNYDKLNNAISSLHAVSSEFEKWKISWKQYIEEEAGLEPSLLAMNRWNWNKNLAEFEKKLLVANGLPGRPVYRNVLFGPQYYAPLAATAENKVDEELNDFEWFSFPGVRDAVYEKNWASAQEQMDRIANLLTEASEQFVS